MKAITSITLLLFFALTCLAQQSNPTQPYLRIAPFDKLKKYNFTPGNDSIHPKQKRMNYYSNFKTWPKPVYSHDVPIGKVYTMPYDNMPCLVPDRKKLASMPCAMPDVISPMPNATPLYFDSTIKRK